MLTGLVTPGALRCGAALVVLSALLCLAARAHAASPEAWQARTFKSPSGLVLPYRLLRPLTVEPAARYPLVLVLHGAGERGRDNLAQLKNGVNELFLAQRDRFPAFVLAPQCPEGQRWVEVDWSSEAHTMATKPSAPMQAVLDLLDEAERELPVDRSRVYVVGISMGGFGTWELLARRPERFAAAVPICGGADLSTAPRVAAVPVWAFHGDKDSVVKVTRSRTMVEALRGQGATVHYTEYAGVGHDAWVRALAEPELCTWLFSQRNTRR